MLRAVYRLAIPAVAACATLVGAGGVARAADAVPGATSLNPTQVAYLSHCGGCHGIAGVSGPTFVPMLRDSVGSFACTDEGRKYLVQVPGVSMSLIRDDQQLADVMNFVLIDLGGKSTPPGFKPYTAAEVHEWRQHPLSMPDFMANRAHVLERSLAACHRGNNGVAATVK
ncbi:c-type cytochrome [Acetobacter ascendens]|uniref:Cytochrome c domain-containing protein n=1 Tax=Acetobacter ascendens TaxID=481146 RepID=A0A1Y0UWI2_9PROT|nr:cystathionine beta-lyase [Acetobacter ascendens]ARW09824.1 hypothetical protein S101447_00722 [Acetobacter ascendens]